MRRYYCYAECLYAECRGALLNTVKQFGVVWILYANSCLGVSERECECVYWVNMRDSVCERE
jgi:hypothetical protein